MLYSIYKIQCDDENYIGSTKNLSKRIYDHNDRSKNDKYKYFNLYKKMEGTQPIYTVLETIECDKKDVFKYEQKWIDLIKPTLNMRDAKQNIDKVRERNKIRMRNKVYTDEEKQIIANKKKIYYEEKKDMIKEKQNIKIRCDICNCDFLKRCKKQHEKTKKHKNKISVNSI